MKLVRSSPHVDLLTQNQGQHFLLRAPFTLSPLLV
jgi:hypothetical protein